LKEEFWGYFYKSRNSNSNSVSKHMIENVKGLKDFGDDFETIAKEQITIIKSISRHIEGNQF
jgi:hypothetical protein